MVEVYHFLEVIVGFLATPEWPQEYRKVAEVATSDLDDAYMLTNNITGLWVDNPEVQAEPEVAQGTRSTSVNDVLVQNGKVFRIEGLGFSRIP